MPTPATPPDSPACNRVTPYGDIEAFPLRGAFGGNRGILHSGRRIVRFHQHDLWITCALRFNDRWREQWIPNRFTWLYFYDEAVSFAAGHRPCAECRWTSYQAYRNAWAEGLGVATPSAREMNRQLHGERIMRGTHRRRFHTQAGSGLPDGAFVELAGAPHVIVGNEAVEWTREGYGARRPRPGGRVSAITPPSTLAVLRAGYPVHIDPSGLA